MKDIALIIFGLFIVSHHLRAEVWQAENHWDDAWDKKYQEWIKSDAIHRKLFEKKGTIFYNFPTDCADLVYILRMVFAWQNKLPYVLTAPSIYTLEGDIISQASPMFDHIKSERGRVKAFMHYISQEKGTFSLIKDTFPLAVKEITSGDTYVTTWKMLWKGGNHAYIVKEIGRDGNGLFYASDIPRKVRKLQKTKKYPDFVFKGKPWGYRRFRKPEYIHTPEAEIPAEEGLSYEQYRLLDRYGADRVLLEIRKRMRR